VFRSTAVLLLCALLFLESAHSASQSNTSQPEILLAPGWGKLSFAAPAPGTYDLPAIGQAAGGAILNSDGDSLDLDDLLGDKVTVLSFIYRTCDDVNGCPLSTMVLAKIASKLEGRADLANKLRLLTLSFDPEFDTPDAMKEFGEGIRGSSAGKNGAVDWRFLTSESDRAIKPILDAYQQSVIPDVQNIKGERKKFSHILRVYLIDRQKQIRNIYNVSFLHPDILINDVLTLLAKESLDEDSKLSSIGK